MVGNRRKTAGASAERHYRRWRRAYRREMAWPLGFMLAISMALAALLRVFLPAHDEFFAGVLLGSAFTLAIAIWDEPPEVIARWKRGADGERATAKALRPLEKAGWHVFHDLASERGNLDHVVVGPGGVFLLDSKNLGGRLVVEHGVLHVRFDKSPVNDHALTGLGGHVRHSARLLRDRIQHQLGWIVDVHPVIVLVSDRFEQGEARDRGVTYVALGRLPDWLLDQPRRIADSDLAAVGEAARALPPAAEIPFGREGEVPMK